MKSFYATSAGLTARVFIYGNVLEIIINGKTAQELKTQSDYHIVAALPDIVPYIPASGTLKYCVYNASIYGQITCQASTGQIWIGYTRSTGGNSAVNIPVDTNIYIKETFIIN